MPRICFLWRIGPALTSPSGSEYSVFTAINDKINDINNNTNQIPRRLNSSRRSYLDANSLKPSVALTYLRARSSSPRLSHSKPTINDTGHVIDSKQRQQLAVDTWTAKDDVFSDFEIVYESMKNSKCFNQIANNINFNSADSICSNFTFIDDSLSSCSPRSRKPIYAPAEPTNNNNNMMNSTRKQVVTNIPKIVQIEAETLDKCLLDVENSYKREILNHRSSSLDRSILSSQCHKYQDDSYFLNQTSNSLQVPSEQDALSELTRADSINTNLSYQQTEPALIEEMTLSDLEYEISTAILSAPSNLNNGRSTNHHLLSVSPVCCLADGELMLRSMRSRAPIPESISRLYSSNNS